MRLPYRHDLVHEHHLHHLYLLLPYLHGLVHRHHLYLLLPYLHDLVHRRRLEPSLPIPPRKPPHQKARTWFSQKGPKHR